MIDRIIIKNFKSCFTISEILNSKPPSATRDVWEGIRGGSSKACLVGTDEVTITVYGTLAHESRQNWEYMIAFSPGDGRVNRERFQVGNIAYSVPEPDSRRSRSSGQ